LAVQEIAEPSEQPKNEDLVKSYKSLADFYGEDRHELVKNLLTSTGKREADRSAPQYSIGLQPIIERPESGHENR
jgi:hypothetical protein